MDVNFAVDLPSDVENQLRIESGDLSAAAREAFTIELFRRGILSHFELGRSLGIDRFETDALLKRHKVTEQSLTHEDIEADLDRVNQILAPGRT